jgi:hypothetical protein
LIFHEVKTRIGTALPVTVGAPIPFASLGAVEDRQALADELRERVYALARLAPATANKPRRAIGKLLRPKLPLCRANRAA